MDSIQNIQNEIDRLTRELGMLIKKKYYKTLENDISSVAHLLSCIAHNKREISRLKQLIRRAGIASN